MTPRCAHCAGPLPLQARSDARFCSGRCRTAACRARNPIPGEMRRRPRWVRFSAAKAPLTVTGRAASSTDPATWSSYAAARRSVCGVGLGFVLNGDGVVCLDLDHCLHDGQLDGWARAILADCGGTYVEVSPSGTGLHVFGYGTVTAGRRIRDHRRVEVYGAGRYIAVTGDRFAGSSLANLDAVIDTFR